MLSETILELSRLSRTLVAIQKNTDEEKNELEAELEYLKEYQKDVENVIINDSGKHEDARELYRFIDGTVNAFKKYINDEEQTKEHTDKVILAADTLQKEIENKYKGKSSLYLDAQDREKATQIKLKIREVLRKRLVKVRIIEEHYLFRASKLQKEISLIGEELKKDDELVESYKENKEQLTKSAYGITEDSVDEQINELSSKIKDNTERFFVAGDMWEKYSKLVKKYDIEQGKLSLVLDDKESFI